MIRATIFVSGRVQGVGFRYKTNEIAKSQNRLRWLGPSKTLAMDGSRLLPKATSKRSIGLSLQFNRHRLEKSNQSIGMIANPAVNSSISA